ncbi:aminodeoxychorismate lyase [Alkalimarinus coralli]|nr:aminodeoxychorismate lyase [Alkalimarinus coralli]
MYGDGLFETVRVVKGIAPLWEYHCKRLIKGCEKLKIETDDKLIERLWSGLNRVIEIAGTKSDTCIVKLIISRGAGGRGYQVPEQSTATEVVICYPAPSYSSTHPSEGVNVTTCRYRLSENSYLAGIKHLNRLDQVLASSEVPKSSSEGIMLDQRGRLIEGTKSNILFFGDGEIVSPATDLCGVDGVARDFVFLNAQELGLSARFERVLPSAIHQFEGMAVTNSVLGIWPVRQMDGALLPISPLVYDIQRLFNEKLMFEYKV